MAGFSQEDRAQMLAFKRDMPEGVFEVGPGDPEPYQTWDVLDGGRKIDRVYFPKAMDASQVQFTVRIGRRIFGQSVEGIVVKRVAGVEGRPALQSEPDLTEDDYRRAARALLHRDDSVEDEAVVSLVEDEEGAYVEAAVWVPNDWARECRREGRSS